MNDESSQREHLLELLDSRSAHIDIKTALSGFPLEHINTRIDHSPHTPWELLDHIRLAQWDILEFSRNAKHVSPDFPDGYWPKDVATAEDWRRSTEQILADLQTIRDLVSDEKTDLFAPFPHGTGQTLLREVLLVADHNAYHLGQLMLLRRILENT